MIIYLQINELVLHGFQRADGDRIAAALETELTRQLSEHGLGSRLTEVGAVDGIDAGAMHVMPNARAETLGTRLGRQVFRGLSE